MGFKMAIKKSLSNTAKQRRKKKSRIKTAQNVWIHEF